MVFRIRSLSVITTSATTINPRLSPSFFFFLHWLWIEKRFCFLSAISADEPEVWPSLIKPSRKSKTVCALSWELRSIWEKRLDWFLGKNMLLGLRNLMGGVSAMNDLFLFGLDLKIPKSSRKAVKPKAKILWFKGGNLKKKTKSVFGSKEAREIIESILLKRSDDPLKPLENLFHSWTADTIESDKNKATCLLKKDTLGYSSKLVIVKQEVGPSEH